MEVNGLPLPAGLVEIHGHGPTEWMLKRYVDAYGHYFDASQLEILIYERLIEETAELPERFDPVPEEYANLYSHQPGLIPDIQDYSKIIVFGEVGSGEPFCLDYRENPLEPTVIYLNAYAYWRRVAPNFTAFIELIEPYDDAEYTRRRGEEEARLLRE